MIELQALSLTRDRNGPIMSDYSSESRKTYDSLVLLKSVLHHAVALNVAYEGVSVFNHRRRGPVELVLNSSKGVSEAIYVAMPISITNDLNLSS